MEESFEFLTDNPRWGNQMKNIFNKIFHNKNISYWSFPLQFNEIDRTQSNINFFRRYFMFRICVRVVKCFQVKCIMAWHHCKIPAFSKNQSWWMLKQWKGMRALTGLQPINLYNWDLAVPCWCDHIPSWESYKNEIKLENT